MRDDALFISQPAEVNGRGAIGLFALSAAAPNQHPYANKDQQQRPPLDGVSQEISDHALMQNAGIFQQCNHADNNENDGKNYSAVTVSHGDFPFLII
jgi:hypothetical protein